MSAVGEKMASAPDWRRTIFFFFNFCSFGYCLLLSSLRTREFHKEKGRDEGEGKGQ